MERGVKCNTDDLIFSNRRFNLAIFGGVGLHSFLDTLSLLFFVWCRCLFLINLAKGGSPCYEERQTISRRSKRRGCEKDHFFPNY